MVFNKTTVIIDPLRPSLFVKKLLTFQKPHFSNFPFLRRRFFVFSVISCFSGCTSKNTCSMHPLGPWVCHCGSTLRAPVPGRANPSYVFACFWTAIVFLNFSICLIVFRHAWHPSSSEMASKSYRLLADGCHSAPGCYIFG